MTISDGISPHRFRKIDALLRSFYPHIGGNDRCSYLYDYTAHGGYQHSDANQLILNFKEPMKEKGKPGWHYKESAIHDIAKAFTQNFAEFDMSRYTFVPVPPSAAHGDPAHDDRIVQMLCRIQSPQDERELIIQAETMQPALRDGTRNPDEYVKQYRINEKLVQAPPSMILVVDDILRTGAHFRAAKTVLRERFPDVRISGLFVARSI